MKAGGVWKIGMTRSIGAPGDTLLA